jgi:hypothetical protein
MGDETSESVRARAAQARRLAGLIHNTRAEQELREIADRLDAAADRLDKDASARKE